MKICAEEVMKVVNSLSEKQRRFVDYYIQSGSSAEAARKAGYSSRSAVKIGSENLTKPDIRNAIQERLKELEDARIAKDKEILMYLSDVMRGRLSEEIVATIGKGDGSFEPTIIVKKVGIKERNKAAELLAKILGIFQSKAEIEIDASNLLITALT